MAKNTLSVILEWSQKNQTLIAKADKDVSDLTRKIDQYGREASTAAGQTAKLGKAGQSAGLGLGKLAVTGAAVTAGLYALQRGATVAWDALEQGAALSLAESRFDNLAASIGTTAELLKNDMAEASRGLMTNAEMVSGASQIISLGLADNARDVVRLTALVTELNWPMQQLVQTFANDSTMRLDSLGLSVEDVTARMKKLEAQGYATEKAFDLAVIEAGEAKVALLGSTSDTTAGKLIILEKAGAEAIETFQLTFADVFVSQLGDIEDAAVDTRNALNDLAVIVGSIAGLGGIAVGAIAQHIERTNTMRSALESGILDYPEFASLQTDLIFGGRNTAQQQARTQAHYEEVAAMVAIREGYLGATRATASYSATAVNAAGQVVDANRREIQVINELGEKMRIIDSRVADNTTTWGENRIALRENRAEGIAIMNRYEEMGRQVDILGGGVDDATGSFSGLTLAMESQADVLNRLSASAGGYFSQIAKSEGRDFDFVQSLFDAYSSAGAGAFDLFQIGTQGGLFDEGAGREYLKQAYLVQQANQLAAEGVNPTEALANLGGLAGELEENATLAEALFKSIDEASPSMNVLFEDTQARADTDQFVAYIESQNPVINVGVNYSGGPPPPPTGGGNGCPPGYVWNPQAGACEAAPHGSAHGGPLPAGVPRIVGEFGREMIIPQVPSQVIPNSDLIAALGGGGGDNITFNISNREARVAARAAYKLRRRNRFDRRHLSPVGSVL